MQDIVAGYKVWVYYIHGGMTLTNKLPITDRHTAGQVALGMMSDPNVRKVELVEMVNDGKPVFLERTVSTITR